MEDISLFGKQLRLFLASLHDRSRRKSTCKADHKTSTQHFNVSWAFLKLNEDNRQTSDKCWPAWPFHDHATGADFI
jgi:hypothetical protein